MTITKKQTTVENRIISKADTRLRQGFDLLSDLKDRIEERGGDLSNGWKLPWSRSKT